MGLNVKFLGGMYKKKGLFPHLQRDRQYTTAAIG